MTDVQNGFQCGQHVYRYPHMTQGEAQFVCGGQGYDVDYLEDEGFASCILCDADAAGTAIEDFNDHFGHDPELVKQLEEIAKIHRKGCQKLSEQQKKLIEDCGLIFDSEIVHYPSCVVFETPSEWKEEVSEIVGGRTVLGFEKAYADMEKRYTSHLRKNKVSKKTAAKQEFLKDTMIKFMSAGYEVQQAKSMALQVWEETEALS